MNGLAENGREKKRLHQSKLKNPLSVIRTYRQKLRKEKVKQSKALFGVFKKTDFPEVRKLIDWTDSSSYRLAPHRVGRFIGVSEETHSLFRIKEYANNSLPCVSFLAWLTLLH
jgi:hypothetical protein